MSIKIVIITILINLFSLFFIEQLFHNNTYFDGIILRTILITVDLFILYRIKWYPLLGLPPKFRMKSPEIIIIPVMVLGVLAYTSFKGYEIESHREEFVIFHFSVGFLEEILLRGLLLILLLKLFQSVKYAIYKAVISSSMVFGILHIIFSDSALSVDGIYYFSFSSSIAVYLCGTLLKSGNILGVAIIHSLFNIAFGYDDSVNQPDVINNYVNNINWFEVVVVLIPLFTGLWLIKTADKSKIIKYVRILT